MDEREQRDSAKLIESLARANVSHYQILGRYLLFHGLTISAPFRFTVPYGGIRKRRQKP